MSIKQQSTIKNKIKKKSKVVNRSDEMHSGAINE